jgi:hypothetical protein
MDILHKLILTLVHLIQDLQHGCNDGAKTSPTGPLVLSISCLCAYNFLPCSSLSKSVQEFVDLEPVRFT